MTDRHAFRHLQAAWVRAGATPAQRVVLAAVWARTDYQSGATWASLATLAADCGLTRSTVAKHLRALDRAGLVATTRVGRRTFRSLLGAVDNCADCAPQGRAMPNIRSRAPEARALRAPEARAIEEPMKNKTATGVLWTTHPASCTCSTCYWGAL